MSQPEEFRDDVYVAEGFGTEHAHGDPIGHAEMPRYQTTREMPLRDMPSREPGSREPGSRDLLGRDTMGREPQGRDLAGESLTRDNLRETASREPAGRAFGSPLPSGSPLPAGNPLGGAAASAPAHDAHASRSAVPPGRALSVQHAGSEDATSARAMNILKQALPFVKGLLPLLDGNLGTALSNVFSGRPHMSAPAQVDLTPVQNQLSDLQLQHNELRTTVQEQTTGIKRVEDQLEMVREATDRNTLEQQELIEDLKAMGNKVNLFAVALSALLLLSVLLNVVLYMHIKRVLP